jgi:hypothetical protein
VLPFDDTLTASPISAKPQLKLRGSGANCGDGVASLNSHSEAVVFSNKEGAGDSIFVFTQRLPSLK